MRTLTFVLPTLALLCASCAGVFVATDHPHHPHPPVVVDDDHPGHKKMAHLGIPPGHLPPPGECRIWFPGRPPGHQPPPGRCSHLERELPAGAWLLHRPGHGKHVLVNVCHDSRPAVLVAIRTYEVASGRFVREERR